MMMKTLSEIIIVVCAVIITGCTISILACAIVVSVSILASY